MQYQKSFRKSIHPARLNTQTILGIQIEIGMIEVRSIAPTPFFRSLMTCVRFLNANMVA